VSTKKSSSSARSFKGPLSITLQMWKVATGGVSGRRSALEAGHEAVPVALLFALLLQKHFNVLPAAFAAPSSWHLVVVSSGSYRCRWPPCVRTAMSLLRHAFLVFLLPRTLAADIAIAGSAAAASAAAIVVLTCATWRT